MSIARPSPVSQTHPIAIAGVALWFATVCIPGLASIPEAPLPEALLWGLLSPIALAVALDAHRRAHRWAPALLLAAYPLSLAPGIIAVDNAGGSGLGSRLVGSMAFLLYGAVTLSRLGSVPENKATAGPVSLPPDRGRSRRRWRGVVLALCATSAFGWLLLAGAGGPAFWQRHWPEAGPEAQTASVLTAALFGTVTLVFFVAPATRREKRLPTRAQRNQRAWMMMSVSIAGLLVLWMLRSS